MASRLAAAAACLDFLRSCSASFSFSISATTAVNSSAVKFCSRKKLATQLQTSQRTRRAEKKRNRDDDERVRVRLTLTFPNPSITARSMFFAPVCTTSNSDLTASWIVSEFDSSGFQFFSRNSRTVFEDLPIAFACLRSGQGASGTGRARAHYPFLDEGELAFHAEKIPLGSVKYSFGVLTSSWSNPTIKQLMPNGLTPPDCVYFCWIPAMCRVMYSTETGSSTVSRCDWHSVRARSIKMRASAVSPGWGAELKEPNQLNMGSEDVTVFGYARMPLRRGTHLRIRGRCDRRARPSS